MNDKSDKTTVEDSDEKADEAEALLAGQKLAAARKERNVSLSEVAKELHLDEPSVVALEENRFEVLGAPVFAKGHLRKYAQLVGVDPNDVLADYYRLTRADALQPVVTVRRRPGRELKPGPWVAVVVILLIVAIVYWLLSARPFASDEPRVRPVAAEPAGGEAREQTPLEEAGDEGDDLEEDVPAASAEGDPVVDVTDADAEGAEQPLPVAEAPAPQRETVQHCCMGGLTSHATRKPSHEVASTRSGSTQAALLLVPTTARACCLGDPTAQRR